MNSSKYTIGVDFGSKSARAVLFDIATGERIAESVKEYSHGVISEYLPVSGEKLLPDWALQDPADYIEALQYTVIRVMRNSSIQSKDVIGIGIDFTSCSMLPVDKNGEPLCFNEKFKKNPHSYVKMWKHHAAIKETDQINKVAKERGEDFLKRYGGKIFSEWLIPKIWQTLNEAPDIYDATHRFMEAGDWIVLQLTSQETGNVCMSGYKSIWSPKTGYASKEFFRALDPRLENVVEEKLTQQILPLDDKAGEVNEKWAVLTGLKKGTAVAVSRIDGHSAVPAVGITDPGQLLMIIGTGTGHFVLSAEELLIEGIQGVVDGGIIPGLASYEAGQSCTGDLFDWFISYCTPAKYEREAVRRKISIHELLREKASKMKAGENGLIALDWWNGNRSILSDGNLTGAIVGYTLSTRPEDVYRALIEATAYGTRMIIENYQNNNVKIDKIHASGGIAEKDEFLMQIYADIINLEITVPEIKQACALGSAIFAAVAAGKEKGGYDSLNDAVKAMSKSQGRVYKPNLDNAEVYNQLFEEYTKLHDYFGRGENDVMKVLKKFKR